MESENRMWDYPGLPGTDGNTNTATELESTAHSYDNYLNSLRSMTLSPEEYDDLSTLEKAYYKGYGNVDDYLMDYPDPREMSMADYAYAVGAPSGLIFL